MLAIRYSGRVKTIEVIRLENYRRLLKELLGDEEARPPDIAAALGISKVYAWQLQNGKRENIDSVAARKIERNSGKEEGWMDTDFSLWPLPDAELLARVQDLKLEERLEVQGAIRNTLGLLEEKRRNSSGKSSPSSPGAPQRKAA